MSGNICLIGSSPRTRRKGFDSLVCSDQRSCEEAAGTYDKEVTLEKCDTWFIKTCISLLNKHKLGCLREPEGLKKIVK